MYTPASFREERPELLRAFIARHPLGALVGQTKDGLSAEHVPMLLDGGTGMPATLRGHVARANPVWRELGEDVLVIFSGPSAYVTPSWYPSKRETGMVVPTWNYGALHVRGRIRFIEDAAWLHQLVSELTHAHETARPAPWAVTDAPPEFIEAMLKAIVGFEIAVDSVVGKWKASQNRSAADRAGVAAGLAEDGVSPGERAELVREPPATG